MSAHRWAVPAPSSLITAAVVLALAGMVAVPGRAAAASDPWTAVSAPGAPGATSYLDLGRKDCLGSATTNRSRVWFTVADGVLSDTYSPTTDNSNLSTLQYLVTDGHSFTDLQTRDMTYVARPLDGTGMSCEIVATARSGRYRIVTDYVTDPVRDSVVMHARYEPLTAPARAYRLYVRYDAMINGAGGGGTANGGANSATITAGPHHGTSALGLLPNVRALEPDTAHLRGPRLRGPRRRSRLPRVVKRLRRLGQRWADPARRAASPRAHLSRR